MKLNEILTKLMKEADISPTKLSKATNVPLSTLHGWMQGIEPRSISQVKNIADFFGINIDYLCFGKDPFEDSNNPIIQYENEINAGTFEVVLRKVKNEE